MFLPKLGIDQAKRKFDVALIVGGKLKHKVCPNNHEGFVALSAWLSRQRSNNGAASTLLTD